MIDKPVPVCHPDLAYSEQIAGIEGGQGKVHPACKDVVTETVSYVESGAPFW
jgi:hypothetical protein